MSELVKSPNLENADVVYNRILAAHQGLDMAESAAFNARLVLVLANHIGDEDVIAQALELARGDRTD